MAQPPEVCCEQCGHRDHGRFCSECSSPLPRVCGCGAVVAPSARFCPGCGKASEPLSAPGGARGGPTSMDFVAVRSDVRIGGSGPNQAAPASVDFVAQNSNVTIQSGREEELEVAIQRRRRAAEEYLHEGAFELAHRLAMSIVETEPRYAAARLLLVKAAHGLGKVDEATLHCVELARDRALAKEQLGEATAYLLAYADPERLAALAASGPDSELGLHLLQSLRAASELPIGRRIDLVRKIWHSASQGSDEARRWQHLHAALDACLAWVVSGEKTVPLCRLLTELEPENDMHWFSLGKLLTEDGKATEAGEALERGLRLDPDAHVGWKLLGDFHFILLADNEQALLAYDRARTLAPEVGDYQYDVAFILSELGRHEESLPFWHEACRLGPQEGTRANGLGVAYLQLGRARDSEPWLERATEHASNDPTVWFNLAHAREQLRDLEGAHAALLHALALNPEHPGAAELREQLERERAHPGVSIAREVHALVCECGNPDATAENGAVDQFLAEADVYLRYGKRDRAVLSLLHALVHDPMHPRVLHKIGEVSREHRSAFLEAVPVQTPAFAAALDELTSPFVSERVAEAQVADFLLRLRETAAAADKDRFGAEPAPTDEIAEDDIEF